MGNRKVTNGDNLIFAPNNYFSHLVVFQQSKKYPLCYTSYEVNILGCRKDILEDNLFWTGTLFLSFKTLYLLL